MFADNIDILGFIIFDNKKWFKIAQRQPNHQDNVNITALYNISLHNGTHNGYLSYQYNFMI